MLTGEECELICALCTGGRNEFAHCRRTRSRAAEMDGRAGRASTEASKNNVVGVCRSAPCAVCCAAGEHLRRSSNPRVTMRFQTGGFG